MVRQQDQKLSIIVVLMTWGIGAVVAVTLGVCGLDWMYYLLGLFTGLLNFGLLQKNNRQIVRMAKTSLENAEIMASRQARKGILLRMLVFFGVFLAIYFKEVYENPNGVWLIITAFSGYLTIKFVFIFAYLIFRRKVENG